MNLTQLSEAIASARHDFEQIEMGRLKDDFQRNAFQFVVSTLERMEDECRKGNLKPKSDRHGVIARIVVESDPSLIAPRLGGRMIDVEKEYQSAE